MVRNKLHGIFVATLLCGVTAELAVWGGQAVFTKGWGLAVGIGMMTAAIPLHWLGRKGKRRCFYLPAILLNLCGSGCAIGTYYTCTGRTMEFSCLWHVWFGYVALCLLLFFSYRFASRQRNAAMLSLGGLVPVMIVSAVLWYFRPELEWSLLSFLTLFLSFFLFAYIRSAEKDRETLREISFASFGAFVLIWVAVATVLSEGEFLDVLDLPVGSRRKR
ncbi:MAG: hypothetical protein HFE85_05340 [Clostridiales bacterium]|nr:hypothetical protein [Clostridiales bacterium]